MMSRVCLKTQELASRTSGDVWNGTSGDGQVQDLNDLNDLSSDLPKDDKQQTNGDFVSTVL